jgi:hypothetical protein
MQARAIFVKYTEVLRCIFSLLVFLRVMRSGRIVVQVVRLGGVVGVGVAGRKVEGGKGFESRGVPETSFRGSESAWQRYHFFFTKLFRMLVLQSH